MIKPPWAASIWVIDDKLYLELPAPKGKRSHQLTFAADREGFAKALSIVQERNEHSTIGMLGDLTQFQADRKKVPAYAEAQVRRVKPKQQFSDAQRMGMRMILRGLGLS